MIRRICIVMMLTGLLLTTAACNRAEGAASSKEAGSDGPSNTYTASGGDSSAGAESSTSESISSSAPAPTGGSSTTASSGGSGTETKSTKGSTTVTVTTTSAAASTTAAPTTAPTSPYLDYKKYNIKTYIQPVWKGPIVYNETVMFVPDAKTKKLEPAPLLYKPDKIVSVRSFDLTKEYKEGVDYTLSDGCIQLTENSRITAWDYDDYFRPKADTFDLQSISAPGRHLKYGAGATFQKTQICVTYTHGDSWSGPVPAYQGGKLPKTVQLLKQKKPISIVYNGDSITVGAESSQWNNIAPFAPIWTKMVTEELRAVYGGSILETNTAVGGMDSAWGLKNVQENIVKHNPNLVVLAFGMNDGTQGVTPTKFQSNIEQTIDAVRARHPDSEFLLVSTTLPNPDANGWTKYQAQYQKTLETIAGRTTGVAVAKMTDMHQYLLTKKRYWDMTGNNINHPNDFLARVYAQVVSQALIQTVQ